MFNSSQKILIVDDSAFFRHRVADVIESAPEMDIVGYATNGQDAIEKANELRPDLITMDVQMPEVDGISAVRRIMAECPTRILMLSVLTRQGARETLDALDAGAIDFMSKEAGSSNDRFPEKLIDKLRSVGCSQLPVRPMATSRFHSVSVSQTVGRRNTVSPDQPKLVAIGASTGGPVALQAVLGSLPRDFSLPVLVAIHMPGSFTSAYAERLNTICAIHVNEATDHAPLRAGQVLIAPGGKQMMVENGASGPHIRIKDALPDDVYHPSIDKFFTSAANALGSHVLAMILTGMGSDGLKGSRKLNAAGAQIWSQNKQSCVVYGMPQAIETAGLSDRVLSLAEMGPQLTKQL